PHRGDVRRPHRRDRATRGAAAPAGAPLYARAGRRRAVSGPRPPARFQGVAEKRHFGCQRLGAAVPRRWRCRCACPGRPRQGAFRAATPQRRHKGAALMISRRPTLGLIAATSLMPGRLLAALREPEFLQKLGDEGKLPPMAERLPKNPLVVDLGAMGRAVGRYGGVVNTLISG